MPFVSSHDTEMNGAESLLRTLAAAGVKTVFSNPGTSEMHFVAALDRVEGVRGILTLFEGVATGAADGYGRMRRRPAATLLHLGPGLANGLANLHNARRADTPVVNIVGDHATSHARYDAPLASDIAGFASPVSAWIHSSSSASSVAADAARAVAAATAAPGQVATLILPADAAWNEAEGVATPAPSAPPAPADEMAVARVAERLKPGRATALLVRGEALLERGLTAAGRIAAASGARLYCDTFPPRLQCGAGRVPVQRLPYLAEQVEAELAGLEQLVLVGARPPVSFFAYPDKSSWLTPEGCSLHVLSHPHEDGPAALEALADALGAPREPEHVTELALPDLPTGALDSLRIGQAVGHLLPEDAIVSDESATSARGFLAGTAHARPHDCLSLTGGSIGQGMPVATGAAVACPERKVVCLHGDGGAMYTLQSLWTQAREGLDVTTVIFANRSYAVLNIEVSRVGAETVGPKALAMLDLHDPELDWVRLAEGMGVHAMRAETAEEFSGAFAACMRERGPHLIEAIC